MTENFFSKIYVSKKFLDLPAVTIPVMDVNEIKAIKPQYLKQYVDNIASILEASINNTTTATTIPIVCIIVTIVAPKLTTSSGCLSLPSDILSIVSVKSGAAKTTVETAVNAINITNIIDIIFFYFRLLLHFIKH